MIRSYSSRCAVLVAAALTLLAVTTGAAAMEMPDAVNFGTIPHSETAVRAVEVRNDGEEPLYLDFVSTCPCLEVTPDSLTIRPGETDTFDLALDPRDYEGTIDKMVMIRSNAESRDRSLLWVRAQVQRAATDPAPGCSDCELFAERMEETKLREWLDENWLVMDVYYSQGCRECERLIGRVIPDLEEELRVHVSVRRHNVLEPKQYEYFVSEMERRGEEITGFPVVTIRDAVLQGDELSRTGLHDAMVAAAGENQTPSAPAGDDTRGADSPADRPTPSPAAAPGGEDTPAADARPVLVDRLAVLPVLAAGLADGVNPCAFATLLFLLSSLAVVGKSRREILVIGAVFAATVFATYFAVGVGLFHALRAASYFPVAAEVIRWAMVAVLVVFAALSVYDYVLVRRGQASRMVLQLPDRFKRRIHASVRRGVRTYSLVAGAVAMGVGVSVFELGCTGQVYLPTISYMVRSGGSAAGYGLLTVYNVGFILPLLALFAAVYVGVGSDGLLRLFKANLARIKLLLAGAFAALAVLMVVT